MQCHVAVVNCQHLQSFPSFASTIHIFLKSMPSKLTTLLHLLQTTGFPSSTRDKYDLKCCLISHFECFTQCNYPLYTHGMNGMLVTFTHLSIYNPNGFACAVPSIFNAMLAFVVETIPFDLQQNSMHFGVGEYDTFVSFPNKRKSISIYSNHRLAFIWQTRCTIACFDVMCRSCHFIHLNNRVN